MDYLLTESQGWWVITLYGVAVILLSYLLTSSDKTKRGFYLAGKKLTPWLAGFSIASSWIWAPALFVSAEKAYTQGIAGLFWFTVPNVATLIMFAWLGTALRSRMPDGYTIVEWIRRLTSKRVQNLYLIQFIGLNICSFAVQLLAGGLAISFLTGIDMGAIAVVMAIMAVIYTLYSGLKSSILTDFIQMGLIILAIAIIMPLVLSRAESGALWAGLGGATGDMWNLFSADGLWVAYSFGISATIGLLSGSVGDQTYWQRALAIGKDRDVKKSFFIGAGIFALVPLTIGLLGFIARGQGLDVSNTAMVNITTVSAFVSTPLIILFLIMLISGLVSTLDSALNSVASLAGTDIADRMYLTEGESVGIGKVFISLTAITGTVIALIPDIKILYLWLFYGTLRASTFLPTIYSLWRPERVREKRFFYGLLVSMFIFVPMFGLGNFNGLVHVTVAGSLLTVFSSGIISYPKK